MSGWVESKVEKSRRKAGGVMARRIEMAVTKTGLRQPNRDSIYWRTQPYAVRLAALEEIRQEYHCWKYGAEPRFQRVYSIVKR